MMMIYTIFALSLAGIVSLLVFKIAESRAGGEILPGFKERADITVHRCFRVFRVYPKKTTFYLKGEGKHITQQICRFSGIISRRALEKIRKWSDVLNRGIQSRRTRSRGEKRSAFLESVSGHKGRRGGKDRGGEL